MRSPGTTSEGELVLGIDLGSSSVKCLILSESGDCLASASASYPTFYPEKGFVEQSPTDWFTALSTAIDNLRSTVNMEMITAIGICGAAHTPVMIDRDGETVRPAVLWNDRRSEKEVSSLKAHHGEMIKNITYNEVSPTWTLPQLMWIRNIEPDRFESIDKIMVSKDYLLYRLTGQFTTDIGMAHSTLLADARTHDWSDEILEIVGISRDQLPSIVPSGEIVGTVKNDVSAQLGLSKDCKVIAGSLDSAAELLGGNVMASGEGMIRVGSAGGVMFVTDRPSVKNGVLLYPHPVSDNWYYQASTNSATTALSWIKDVIFPDNDVDFNELDRLASDISPGSDGMLFHPYLLAERAPHWNSEIRGNFSGLSMAHTEKHFIRAVQEGVAFSLRDCYEILLNGSNKNPTSMNVVGGGANSDLWIQILADTLGVEVTRTATDASALGISLLTAVSSDVFPNWSAAFNSQAGEIERIRPTEDKSKLYDEIYEKYRQMSKFLIELEKNHSTRSL